MGETGGCAAYRHERDAPGHRSRAGAARWRGTSGKSPGYRSQDERSFSACHTAVRRYLRPARAGSAAAITPSAPVMLHVLSASTQLGAHRRPACTTQHVRYR